MAFGSSLEPPSVEGWAASVQSEARARGEAICSLRLGRDGARDALAGQDDPREARLTRARARCTVPYWSGLYHMTHEPYETAVDTRLLHNHHT